MYVQSMQTTFLLLLNIKLCGVLVAAIFIVVACLRNRDWRKYIFHLVIRVGKLVPPSHKIFQPGSGDIKYCLIWKLAVSVIP